MEISHILLLFIGDLWMQDKVCIFEKKNNSMVSGQYNGVEVCQSAVPPLIGFVNVDQIGLQKCMLLSKMINFVFLQLDLHYNWNHSKCGSTTNNNGIIVQYFDRYFNNTRTLYEQLHDASHAHQLYAHTE